MAIVLANYPIRDGRLANGVGYDAPESTVRILREIGATDVPANGNALIELLQAGPTNAHPERGEGHRVADGSRIASCSRHCRKRCSREVIARWGEPEADPFVRGAAFHLPVLMFGNVAVAAAAGARL